MMQKRTKPKITNNSAKGMVWDLSELYKSLKDPKINKDLRRTLNLAEKFHKKYKGKINNKKLTAKLLLKILKEYELVAQLATMPYEYAELTFSTNNQNKAASSLMQKAEENYVKVSNLMIFFSLELAKSDNKLIERLIKKEELKDYVHYIQKVRSFKKYQLFEAEEKILSLKSQTSSSALHRLFEDMNTDIEYEFVDKKNKTEKINQSQVLKLLHHADRSTRKKAAACLTKGLKNQKKPLSFIFNKLLLDKKINDELRNFKTPQASRHLGNELNEKIVDNLTKTCEKNYDIVSQYYSLKKKLLNLPELCDWDRYAPIKKDSSKIKFSQAREIILKSFENFHPKFKEVANDFFKHKKIHAELRNGKRGGAYCNLGTPKYGPYIFLNYAETNRDVLSLAHEIGHAIHAVLAKRQNLLNFDPQLVVAEIASVFCEILTFQDLKEVTKDKKARLVLICRFLEDVFATVFRQINIYKFELEAHELFRKKGELSTEEINKLWRNNQQKMFGGSLKMTEDYGYWWLYVSHVFGAVSGGMFYVYAYTFANLLVLAIYAEYKKQGTKFINQYIELLSSGGREKPADLLKIVNQDITKPNFWQKGMDLIRELLDEAKKLAKEVNYKI